MAKITTNKKINLFQLDQELGSFGLCMDENDAENKIIITAEHSQITQTELENAVANHVAIFRTPTIEEKLASLGLSIDDLKSVFDS